MLVFTILCACAFLVIKGVRVPPQVPGGGAAGRSSIATPRSPAPGANLFFTIYFLTTGLHAFHVIVGMSVLIWVLVRVLKGQFSPDLLRARSSWAALYWHLVDLVWIFLFPLLYLI